VSQIDEILGVIGITVVAVCGLFVGLIINMEKEHKREKKIREAKDNKGSVGQHNKSGNDESSKASTTSTAPATSEEKRI
jgi:hypothetical protein